LTLQGRPIVFVWEIVIVFNIQCTGLESIGLGIRMLLDLATQSYWNWWYREYEDAHGREEPLPEFQLWMGQVRDMLAPIGLFWLAFTPRRALDPHDVPVRPRRIPVGRGVRAHVITAPVFFVFAG